MTNELNERKITETLSGVLMPGSDRSLIDAGAVSGIVIKDGHIGFTIEIDPKDKDKNQFLDVSEFPHPNAFRGGDKNKDGKLSREEHLNIFRGQFFNVDVNKDGKITAADKQKDRKTK